MTETIDNDRPAYYIGENGLEINLVVEAWGLTHYLASALEYIIRAGRKSAEVASDLRKARWHLIHQEVATEDRAYPASVADLRSWKSITTALVAAEFHLSARPESRLAVELIHLAANPHISDRGRLECLRRAARALEREIAHLTGEHAA